VKANTATHVFCIEVKAVLATPKTTSILQDNKGNAGYSFTPVWTGGNGALTYSVSAGTLPTGLSMNAGTGNIHGTATVPGYYNFTQETTDTTPSNVTRAYGMGVFPIFDAYGGLSDYPIPGCVSTGYFQVIKTNGRWLWATPTCHAWYERSMYATSWQFLNSGAYASKYGNNKFTWATNALKKLQQYGYNAYDIYSDCSLSPISNLQCGFSGSTPQIPFFLYWPSLNDAVTGYSHLGLTERIKSECSAQNSNGYHGYCNDTIDIFDPNWSVLNVNQLAWQQTHIINGTFNTSPWIAAITLGDASNVGCALGQGNTFGSPYIAQYPHCGQIVATATFNYNCYPVGNCTSTTWSRPVNYSKRAWGCGGTDVQMSCNGTSYLETKYHVITTLNSAWGSNYTTFGTSCGYPTFCTFGSGTGLMDEDGRHTAWFGSDYYTQSGMNHNLITDINFFSQLYAYNIYKPQIDAIRAFDTNHIYTCGSYGGVGNGGMRPNIVAGFKSAGCTVLTMDWNSNNAANTIIAENADIAVYNIFQGPIDTWYGISANCDSNAGCSGNPSGQGNFPTQAARAAQYWSDAQTLFNLTAANSDKFIVGTKQWSMYNTDSPSTNWGSFTANDNAFDMYCPIVATGQTNAQGIACGGESANYGNYLDGNYAVTYSHIWVLNQLLQVQIQNGIYITAPSSGLFQ
jgi:hypothetical protein